MSIHISASQVVDKILLPGDPFDAKFVEEASQKIPFNEGAGMYLATLVLQGSAGLCHGNGHGNAVYLNMRVS